MSFVVTGLVLAAPLYSGHLKCPWTDKPTVGAGFIFELEPAGVSVTFGGRNELLPFHRILHVLRQSNGDGTAPLEPKVHEGELPVVPGSGAEAPPVKRPTKASSRRQAGR